MDYKYLEAVRDNAKMAIINAILQYVKEHGEDVTDYDINEFGLDGDMEDGCTVTKVFDFFNNGGCFYCNSSVNDRKLEDIDDGNWYDKLYSGITHTAIQCLYIVVDENGNEYLKYYQFYNGGVDFDDDQAEPDHDDAMHLSLIDLDFILTAIGLLEK